MTKKAYPQLKGTGVALVTPFKEDKSIDYTALEKLLIHTAEGGVNYWVVMGTTGESVTLNKDEKKEILAFVKKNNPHKIPIVYGIGGNNTQELLHTLQDTDLEGVEAILSVSPYYNKPSQEGIYQHYITLAEASPKPLLLYNVPGRTASNISAQTTLKLAQHPNIIGTKEASGNIEQCLYIAKNRPENFLLISGDDLLTATLMAMGGEGVVSVLANAIPQIFAQTIELATQQKFIQANNTIAQILSINPLMYEESNPTGVKQALEILNITSAEVRLPLIKASATLKEKIQQSLQEILKM
ncbi:MAG: 4-hydroxy-tetrahydrodipicolinate synthase [Cytophagales bacterium]|nr:MAG: 4-hydroxy-tetrahydrodipicolinate synthase [Cytophagales bacterium]